ncbi:MAG: arsenic transporter [Vulcanimicrobiaceae bacterium]
MAVSDFITYGIAVASLTGILVRPRRTPEWLWAMGGAVALVAVGRVSPPAALLAVERGNDVYLFLGGMLVLAEIARAAAVFDWLATVAVRSARGSAARFFTIVFGVGVVVTITLSNDATAVVLTPAVAAAARKARTDPLPHLFVCALVANAASFVVPIANPANLVVFGSGMPTLATWLATFALPSCGALVVTFAVLRLLFRRALATPVATDIRPTPLGPAGRVSLGAIVLAALVLAYAASRGLPLGAVTAAAAAVTYAVAVAIDSRLASVLARPAWGIIALVAGLFVLVAGVDAAGVLAHARRAVVDASGLPQWEAIGIVGTATALLTNVTNNLPAGLLSGLALERTPHSLAVASATAIGIDLGPNLSASGSLATLLWLIALRREGIAIGPWAFARTGVIVMPTALAAALVLLAIGAR